MSRTRRPPASGVMRCVLVLAVLASLFLSSPKPVRAAGAVGDGTPGSCTEAAFGTALTGGGLVTFSCGPDPVTIVLTTMKEVALDTEIRGDGLVTLSGGDTTSLLQVYSGVTLTLSGLELSRAGGGFGAIESFGTVIATGVDIMDGAASGSGGGIANYGTLNLTNVTISGNAAGGSGGGIFNDGGDVTLSGCRLSDNTAGGNGAGISSNGVLTVADSQIIGNTGLHSASPGYSVGGGIHSSGALTVTDSVIRGNTAASGGGIHSTGTIVLTGVTLELNRALYPGPANGGGLYNGGTGTVSGARFVDNTAGGYAGGLYNADTGNLTVTAGLFSGNDANVGGAVANQGRMVLRDSVLHGNTGSPAGIGNGVAGFPVVGELTLTNVTLSGNNAVEGQASALSMDRGSLTAAHLTVYGNQGGAAVRQSPGATVRINNSIVAGNTPQNCAGVVISEGYNYTAGDTSCNFVAIGDKSGAEAMLGPLADNGGGTLTHLPLAGSPAIDGGECRPGITTDQRGAARPVGPACDIGAVEYAADPPGQQHVYLALVRR